MANSRGPNPVVERSAAVGVRARCFRTSLSRLVAIVWDGFRAERRAKGDDRIVPVALFEVAAAEARPG